MPALQLNAVSKSFATKKVARDVTFAAEPGELIGLLGPNGAGKTTLIRMILGILKPDAGAILLFGAPGSGRASRRLGYLPEERGLYQRIRVDEQLLYFAGLRGVPRAEARRRMEEGLAFLGLSDWRARKIRELSKGMQQLVQILAALLHGPELVFLDEPFVGLDPINRGRVEALLRASAGQGATVFLSTHQMDKVEALCDRVLLMNEGRILLDGPVAALKDSFGDRTVWVALAPGVEFPELREADSVLFGAGPLGRERPLHRVRLADGVKPSGLLATLVNRGFEVRYFAPAEPSVEEIFLRAVQGDRP